MATTQANATPRPQRDQETLIAGAISTKTRPAERRNIPIAASLGPPAKKTAVSEARRSRIWARNVGYPALGEEARPDALLETLVGGMGGMKP